MTPPDTAFSPAGDDSVFAFEVKPLGIRGRSLRLGPEIHKIISQHDYPAPVSRLLGEAVALTTLLGSTLKFDGKLILQTNSDGPVSMLVVDFVPPGFIRGYARFDAEFDYDNHEISEASELIGKGHLALTIDQGPDMERYQGIVALDGIGLAQAAHTYFQQSEQLPTAVQLAAGELVSATDAQWRAGAIMVQHLPSDGPPSPIAFSPGDAPDGGEDIVEEDDNWTKARLLLETADDHELLDPTLASEQLLYRLYHEDGVTVYPAQELSHKCSCSRERVATMLDGFSPEERHDMIEDDKVRVTCQFCSKSYDFAVDEIA